MPEEERWAFKDHIAMADDQNADAPFELWVSSMERIWQLYKYAGVPVLHFKLSRRDLDAVAYIGYRHERREKDEFYKFFGAH